MKSLAFIALSNLVGRPCTYHHGDTTFTDCIITRIEGTDTIRIEHGTKRIQSITPTSIFALVIVNDVVKITFII